MHARTSLQAVVKDRLRTVRFLAREMKGSLDRIDGQGIVEPLRSVAHLSDRALTRLEGIAVSLAPKPPPVRAEAMLALLRQPTMDRARAFAAQAYLAVKAILAGRSVENLAVSESALLKAYWAAAWRPGAERRRDATLAAGLAVAVAKARPVGSPSALPASADSAAQDANIYVACTLALGLLAAAGASEAEEADPLEAAAIGVDVMYDQFAAAIGSAGDLAAASADRLAGLFDATAPHLH